MSTTGLRPIVGLATGIVDPITTRAVARLEEHAADVLRHGHTVATKREAGFVPQLTGSTSQFLAGTGEFATVNAPQVVKKTADTVFASATPANVPQGAAGVPAMSFSVTANHYYYFRFVSLVRSDTSTVGPAMSVTVPAVTRFGASGKLIGAGVDGLDCEFQGAITTSDDPVLPGNVAVINTDFIFTIEGLLVPSADGALTLRARTETGTTNVTVRQGSIGMLWDLGT